jgi:hypothetical protein
MNKYVFLLIPALFFCGCSRHHDKQLKEYLDSALMSAQKEDWIETRQWFGKIEEMGYVNVDVLIPYLKENDEKFRFYLIELMGNIEDNRCVEPLIKILEQEKSPSLRLSIIEALGKLKDARAVPVLENNLYSRIWGIRFLAANALEQITGKTYEIQGSGLRVKKKKKK